MRDLLILLAILAILYFLFRKEGFTQSSTLYFFYADWCGHSQAALPAWKEVEDKLKGLVKTVAVNVDKPESETLVNKFTIKGYPTYILSTPSRNIEYSGDRSAESLIKFAQSI